jgi:hypothetical protein
MLQAALKYVCDKYQHVRFITLTDKTSVPNSKIHITAKRLLQGRPGWYQEYLQAVPTDGTIKLLQLLSKKEARAKIAEYLPVTSQISWGIEREIEEMAQRILPMNSEMIVGTSWRISRDHVLAYPIVYNKTSSGGGGGSRRSIHNVRTHKSRNMRAPS